jgi:hypothetical protein
MRNNRTDSNLFNIILNYYLPFSRAILFFLWLSSLKLSIISLFFWNLSNSAGYFVPTARCFLSLLYCYHFYLFRLYRTLLSCSSCTVLHLPTLLYWLSVPTVLWYLCSLYCVACAYFTVLPFPTVLGYLCLLYCNTCTYPVLTSVLCYLELLYCATCAF